MGHAGLHPDAAAGPFVLLEVQDTGQGIPPGIIDKIFDPFFTTKDVGRGTVSTALGIVKSQHGFVTVESEIGKGSVFRVFLPGRAGRQGRQPQRRAVRVAARAR